MLPRIDWSSGSAMVRLFLATEGLGLAAVLVLPGDVFGLSASFVGMHWLMGEDGWAALLGAQGLLCLAGLLWPRPWLVSLGSAAGGFVYALMGILIAASATTTGIVTYLNLGWLALWSVWREAAHGRPA